MLVYYWSNAEWLSNIHSENAETVWEGVCAQALSHAGTVTWCSRTKRKRRPCGHMDDWMSMPKTFCFVLLFYEYWIPKSSPPLHSHTLSSICLYYQSNKLYSPMNYCSPILHKPLGLKGEGDESRESVQGVDVGVVSNFHGRWGREGWKRQRGPSLH